MQTRILVEDLQVECLIGCLDVERTEPQVVRVDLEVDLDVREATRQDALHLTWNYASLVREVSFVLQAGRFHLLETAGRVALRYLLLPPQHDDPRAPATWARIVLTKFHVLPGEARPRVEVSGHARDEQYVVEQKRWGTVDVVDENKRLGLYRLNVAPGRTIPNHVHRRMREEELVLTAGLVGWVGDEAPRPLAVNAHREWNNEAAHGYRNVGERTASVLCLNEPPFDPVDEIEVPLRMVR